MKNMAKVNVVIMIGVAGSGKSTYIENLRKNTNKVTFSFESDAFRKMMYGSLEEGNKHNEEVFKKMNEEFLGMIEWCNRLEVDSTIFYDATNINRRRRRNLYKEIKRLKCDTNVIAVMNFATLETLMENNDKRPEEKKVPVDVIMNMYKTIQVPRIGADCDEIGATGERFFDGYPMYNIDEIFELCTPKLAKELSRIRESHENPHHLESISEHIDLCLWNSKDINLEMQRVALFHDLGKSLCKEVKDDGVARYLGHATVSAYYYMNYIYSKTKAVGADFYNEDEVYILPDCIYMFDALEMIYQHMNAHQGIGTKNIRNNNLNDELLKKIYKFAEIDSMSRISGVENENKY